MNLHFTPKFRTLYTSCCSLFLQPALICARPVIIRRGGRNICKLIQEGVQRDTDHDPMLILAFWKPKFPQYQRLDGDWTLFLFSQALCVSKDSRFLSHKFNFKN